MLRLVDGNLAHKVKLWNMGNQAAPCHPERSEEPALSEAEGISRP
jgi:hypothetical protein